MSLHPTALRYLVAVADHHGVTAAATALGVSQPAVSRALQRLEAEARVALVQRAGRGILLTAAAEELVRHARGILAAERVAEEGLAAHRGLKRGTLRLGASTTISTYVLPAIVSRFIAAHPHIEIELSSVPTRDVCDRLLDYKLDIALAEAPVFDDRIVVRPWQRDELVLIAAPTHPLAMRRRVLGADLSTALILLREKESGSRDIVLAGLRKAGITARRTLSVEGTEVIKQLVAAGVGLGIVSRIAVAEQLAAGRLVTLDIPGLRVRRTFNRLELHDHRPSAPAHAFSALLGPLLPQKNN